MPEVTTPGRRTFVGAMSWGGGGLLCGTASGCFLGSHCIYLVWLESRVDELSNDSLKVGRWIC